MSKRSASPSPSILSLNSGSEYFSDIIDNDDISSVNSSEYAESLTLQEKYLAPTDSEDDDFAKPATTIGNVPLEWYDDYPHIGYDIDGKRVIKPATKDELDALLERMDDPKFLATFKDSVEHKDVTLTMEELEIIKKLQSGRYPHSDYDPYPEFDEPFVRETMVEPLIAAPEPKRRFVRSKWEQQKIMKIVGAIRKGLILPKKPKKVEKEKFYDIWKDDAKEREPHPMHINAPKLKLPNHAESYHPPEEYKFNEQELEEWKNTDPEDREQSFVPQDFENLRSVPAYPKFIQERFARCLDLYLCPRTIRKRVVDPESLLPKLPDPKDLEPFPKYLAITFKGHSERVRTFSIDPTGEWMVSGSDDKTVRLWETISGKCLRVWNVGDIVQSVAWNPNKSLSLFSVACGKRVILINPQVAHETVNQATEALFEDRQKENKSKLAKWMRSGEEIEFKVVIEHINEVNQVIWHKRGDYFATVCTDAGSNAVVVHQLTKQSSQNPFAKAKGMVQKVCFHPSKPLFFVATQKYVRIYNLVKQELESKLMPGCKWISSIDIHPGGDNLIVGTYDKKVCWFDLDIGTQPYQTLRGHEYAVRSVAFHRRFPLFASAGDDGKVQIFHGMVYNDYMQNPLIVPVRKLSTGHKVGGLGCFNVEFHPTQPWVFTSGADGTIKLFS